MAKKRQRRMPRVPRSREVDRAPRPGAESIEGLAGASRETSVPREASTPRLARPAASTPVPRVDFAAEYEYVRKDLTRIFVLSVLIFGTMAALRIAGF